MTRPADDAILRPMIELVYFAYGSNMATRRLRHRVPSARPIGPGRLEAHRLAWHKKGADGSGKCDIAAGRPGDVAYGVLFRIDAAHKPRLDHAEGLGWGYELKQVDIRLLNRDETVRAFTYYATRIDATCVPYDWYRDHVLIGAREHALPGHYVRLIENVPTFGDADTNRARAERRVHEDN